MAEKRSFDTRSVPRVVGEPLGKELANGSGAEESPSQGWRIMTDGAERGVAVAGFDSGEDAKWELEQVLFAVCGRWESLVNDKFHYRNVAEVEALFLKAIDRVK